MLPHLRPPPPGDQSQSALTSHICQLSTRLQTLSEAVFAAACGCGRLEDHARTGFDAARCVEVVLLEHDIRVSSLSFAIEIYHKHVLPVSWPEGV
jgi:hypothetical protein